MAKPETAQIAQLDERIKSLDANIKQLITDVDAFKDRLSKTNSSGVEQMKREYQSLQKKVEEVGMSQAKTAKNVEEQIQRVSRSRRVDNKILERQNQLLAAQKRLAATGDIGQRFSTLRNSIGGIDFNSILAKANAPTDKGFKMLHESVARRSETAMRQFANAQNEAKKSVEKTTSSIKAQKGSLESMLPTIRRLASAFGVAFSVQGLVQFGKKLVETRGQFEMQFVAMKQIIGDVDDATKIWNQTMQQALQSPFKAMQLVDYTKKLAAYRIETDKLFDTTKRLADVSAGLGVDMGRLILAYGQVKTANYLRASEVRQFTEAGVNIYGELAKYFSEIEGHAVSTAEVVERTSKRMVLFSDVEAIFKRMTDEGGTFFNMQEVQSDTVRGQIMKLHDAYDQMLNTIGESNQGTIRDLVDTLNKLVRNWQDIAYVIKFNLSIFLPYIAATKVAAFGMKRAGDASLWFSNKLIGQRVALSSTNEILKLNSATLGFWQRSLIRATKGVQAFVIGLKSIGRAVLPFAILEGIIFLTEKISEAHRAAARLKEDLEGIKFGNAESLQSNIQGFDRLKKAIEDSNDGSQERLRLIEQMNNKYGDYLPHLITEIDTVQQLNDAYDSVIQSMREYSYAKTKEQGEERIRKEMFEVYNDAVNDLFGTKSNRQVSYGETGSFYLEKHEIQDVLKQVQDELIKNPELNGQTLVNRLIANYTGIQDAHVDYLHIWAGYVEDMRKQVKEMQNLERYAEETVSPTYRSGEERSKAEELRKKAEAELAAANEAWAKEKDSLTHTIEDSVLKGIQDARKEAAHVDREEGESDAEYNIKLWNARVRADEDANEAIKKQHIITNFAIEEKEKEHQARLLKIRLDNQQISAESYNKQMLAIYPELDDRIKQYNDKIRAMIVGQFGEEWSGNADAITLFKQMRIGIDDISQGVAQYQKNFAGTVENQKKIVQDLYDWKERGYNVDEKDLSVQREKLAVYVRMARLLGVKTDYNPIGSDLFTDIQRQFNNKYGNKPTPYLPFGNTFFGLEEGDRMLSQIELLDKYTKKWQEYEKTYKTLVESKKNNKDLSDAAAADLDAQIEEAKKNTEASKFLIDLLGYIAKATGRSGRQYKDFSALLDVVKKMNGEYEKLSKSAYGYAKSAEMVKNSYREAFDSILGKGASDLVNWDTLDFTSKQGVRNALQELYDNLSSKKLWGKYGKEVKDLQDKLKREIANFDVEIGIDAQVRIREDFGRQMEEAFGNYELTLDLQKLNLPSDVLSDLFDVDAIDTPVLRKKLDALYETLKDENGGVAEESFKVYENWLKKIDDAERKLQRDRLKSYSKYLEYQVSERAKIEMEYARKVAEVQAESAFGGENEQLRSRILDGLKREYNEKIAKQDWEDFKGSEMYVQMMEDLTRQGTASLEIMRKKLVEVRDNAENLSPRALKEVINAIEKIDDEFYNRQSPFARIGKYKKEFEEAMSSAEYENIAGVFEDDAAAKEDYENSRRLHEMYENIIGDKTTLADITKKLNDITEEYNITGQTESDRIEEAKKQLELYRQALKRDLNARNNLGGRTKDNASSFDLYTGNINASKAAIGALEEYIKLTTEYVTLTEKLKGTEYENISIEQLSKLSKEQLDAMGWSEDEQKRLGNIINLWRRYNKAISDGLSTLSDYVSRIGDLYSSVTSNLDALGVTTDVLDKQWISSAKVGIDSIKTMIDAVKEYKDNTKEAVDNGKNLLEAGATGDYIRLAIALLKVLIDVAAQFGLIHDAAMDKEIERQQLKIDALKDAYARLEKQIEKTWSSVSYMQTYEQQVANIRDQITAMEAQMAAEKAKKDTDDNAVRQYQRDIQDAYDQLDELEQKSIEVFGGIGEEGYRSAAEGFVDAWKSAFLETGDGLQGLQDHFDEFLQDWFVKQATMRIAGNMMAPLFSQIDKAVDKYGEGGTSAMLSEIERVRDMAAAIFPDLSLALEDLAGMFGVGGEGSLSGLAAGIQGMTEEQANILEAYWNSVRMYTASIDQNVAMIASALGVGGNSPSSNPMLQQMNLIAANTQATHQLLQSVTRSGHSLGGYGIKVFND